MSAGLPRPQLVMSPLATAWMPEVEQCREQLPKFPQRLAALATAMDGGSAENAGADFPLPWPRLNLIRYFGVLAPNAKLRRQVVPKPRDEPVAGEEAYEGGWGTRIAWARLLKRVFDIDVEQCPHCGGQLKIISAEDIHLFRVKSSDASSAASGSISVFRAFFTLSR